jgi:hypothetical protein
MHVTSYVFDQSPHELMQADLTAQDMARLQQSLRLAAANPLRTQQSLETLAFVSTITLAVLPSVCFILIRASALPYRRIYRL